MNDAEVNRIRVTDVTNIWDLLHISYILRLRRLVQNFDGFARFGSKFKV